MLALLRLPITMMHLSNRAGLPLNGFSQALLPMLCSLKFLYRSMNYTVTPRITSPDRDFSASFNVAQSNWLITRLSKDGKFREARQVFDGMPDKDVVTWTTVITGYIRCGMMEEARRLFDRVDAKKDVITWTALVSGYIRLKQMKEAERLFYQMPVKNVVSWNTMIDGYARNCQVDMALELFERMPEKNVVSWNTVLTALAHCGRIEEARTRFNLMPERDVISWTAMVAGFSRNGMIDEAREFFDRMPKRNVVSWNAMITGYTQNMRLDEALELFERMPGRDMPSWNTMITGFLQNGDLKRAQELFIRMPQKNVISWTTMITGHAGLVEEGLKYFNELLRDGSIQVREDHYTCLVDLCGRAGRLKEAFNVLEKLGTKISASVWGALLAGCNVHGNMDIGKLAAEKLLEEEPEKAGTYLLLCNIYASSGKWREAAKIRMKMKEKGLKKQPGCSWIEVGNKVHVFVVGDKSHYESELIYSLIYNLHERMKKIGYIPYDDLTVDDDFS